MRSACYPGPILCRVEKWCFRFQYNTRNQDQLQLPQLSKKYVEDPKRDPKGKISLPPLDPREEEYMTTTMMMSMSVTKTRTICQREPPNQFQRRMVEEPSAHAWMRKKYFFHIEHNGGVVAKVVETKPRRRAKLLCSKY